MERKEKSIVWIIIKILIIVSFILFIYGCYHFNFLKNNKYIANIKEKISNLSGIIIVW